MSELYIPLMNSAVTAYTPEAYLPDLAKLSVKRIFLAVDRAVFFLRGEERRQELFRLRENAAAFQAAGYAVGLWTQAFGFGDPLSEAGRAVSAAYTPLRSITGRERSGHDAFCPENEQFTRDYMAYIADLAAVGCDMILLDDDFCLSVRPGLDCFCDRHLSLLEAELGESLAGKDLKALFFTGGGNQYRRAWHTVMGRSLVRFAQRVRAAVDQVDPQIRMGFCAGYTSWDIEGVDALTLTRVLAGKTKPILRFTGAPYWAAPFVDRFAGLPLAAVIEEARFQAALCRGEDVEVLIENDSYPRPRYNVPSSLLECFALPLATEAGVGELSYLFDYTASPAYETGYLRHRLYHQPLYDFIEKHFTQKSFSGVRVFNEPCKIENAEIDESATEKDIMRGHFHRGAELLGIHGIPTVYGEDAPCGIVFGEDARYIDKLPAKAILDMKAAIILRERGFDVGFSSASEAESPAFERAGGERIHLSGVSAQGYYHVTLRDDACLVSEFEAGGVCRPAAYTYRSGDTELLVYTFCADKLSHRDNALTSYLRGEQLRQFCRPAAYMEKAPGLYQICKEGDGETALLFVNISPDPVFEPCVKLSRAYSNGTLCGAAGKLVGTTLRLDAPIAPYGAFAAVLKE